MTAATGQFLAAAGEFLRTDPTRKCARPLLGQVRVACGNEAKVCPGLADVFAGEAAHSQGGGNDDVSQFGHASGRAARTPANSRLTVHLRYSRFTDQTMTRPARSET
jgi:hypothetical protein